MEIETNKSVLFELRCAAGSWLDGVKEGETFCIFTKKGANLKKDLKSNNFYCVLPRELYQKHELREILFFILLCESVFFATFIGLGYYCL